MQEFLAFVANIFGMSPDEISLKTSYNSISEWDSLMQLRLVAEISDQYDVDIPIDEVPNIKTLEDFYYYIETK